MIKQIILMIIMNVFSAYSMKSDHIHSLDFLVENNVVRCSEKGGSLEMKPAYDKALSGLKIRFSGKDALAGKYDEISLILCGLDRPPIVQLSSLKSFWCVENPLESPPIFIGASSLGDLNLSYNNLKIGPIDRQLPQIKYLCLGRNKITEFEFNSETLIDLDLTGNQLKEFARCTLPDLKLLSLSENRLESPPDVSSFTNLTFLSLHKNKLRAAPDVRSLSKLIKLFLGHNLLQEFPAVPSSLVELELQGNCIRHVPEDLDYPKALWLSVGRNYLSAEGWKKLLALGLKSVEGKKQKRIRPDH